MTTADKLQAWLDILSGSVMKGNFAVYRAHVSLPFQLTTLTASTTIDTEESLKFGFDTYVQMLRSQRVTDYIQLVSGAEQPRDDVITGRYTSHLLVGGNRLVPPFGSTITLQFGDGLWRATSITSEMANDRWPIHLIQTIDRDIPKGPDA